MAACWNGRQPWLKLKCSNGRGGSSPSAATNFMDTQNTTNYDAGKIAKREAMRKELKRMKMQHMIELNQTISEKSDVIAKRWIEELKQK